MRVLRVATGLRPYRKVVLELKSKPLDQPLYTIMGAGGYGYQAGLGMADHATALHLDLPNCKHSETL